MYYMYVRMYVCIYTQARNREKKLKLENRRATDDKIANEV